MDLTDDDKYLRSLCKTLNEREKVVALIIDEIHTKSTFTYKQDGFKGLAENPVPRSDHAKTIQAFMIASVFGNFHQIAKLVPVSGCDGLQLKTMTEAIIKSVQIQGFKVVVVITDNHRVNQALFKHLCPGYGPRKNLSFANPCHPEEEIFLKFDPVHIFKNIRNNWTLMKDVGKSFNYPNFETGNIQVAKFHDLTQQFVEDFGKTWKSAYKLNYQTIHPSSLQKQRVRLVCNIFDDSTIAALRKNSEFIESAEFIQIIKNWWEIMNVKTMVKGFRKRNIFMEPFSSTDDWKIGWLEKFLAWLKLWGELDVDGKLKKDTYEALYTSTEVTIKLIKYSFEKFHVKYVLTGNLLKSL